MSPFLIAIQTLTPLLLAGKRNPRPAEAGEAVAYFPVAGLLAGLVVLAACAIAGLDRFIMHTSLLSVLILALWVWFGSRLHLEGLADTLQGLASPAKGGAMLKVMRQPGVGACGVMGVFLALLAKFVWLEALTSSVFWLVPFPMIVARACQSLACGYGRYAGGPRGAARDAVRNSGPMQAWVATGYAFALIGLDCVLSYWKFGVSVSQIAWALAACVAGLAIGLAFLWIPARRLKGLSGHLLGYASEICEISTAFFLIFLLAR